MNVQPGASFEAVIDTGTPGIAPTIGVALNDNLGITVWPYTGGAIEIAAGVYSIASVVAPATIGQYTLIWTVGGGTVLGVEDLIVTGDAAPVIPPPPTTGGTGMSGAALITEFLADKRFGTSRARILGFLNYRYTELLGLEEWAFLEGLAQQPLDGPTVSGPFDLGLVWSLYHDDDGCPLDYLELADFQRAFLSGSSPSRPVAFAVLGTSLLIGPAPDTLYMATLLYQRQPPPLTDDATPSILPPGTEAGLVAGAQAYALELENDPSGGPLEARYQRTIDAMRRRYLVTGRAPLAAMPRDPLAYR